MTDIAHLARSDAPAEPPAPAIEPLPTPAPLLGIPAVVWVLMLSALAARLAVVLIHGDWSAAAGGESGSIAASLVAGSGFSLNQAGGFTQHGLYEPSSAQGPTYPLLLTGLYWAFGVKSAAAHASAQLINAIAGALTVPLIYLAVLRVGGRHAVALAAAALLAMWPTQLFAVAFVQTVTLLTLAILGMTLLWYRSTEGGEPLPWLAFGCIASLAALTEPVMLAVLPISLLMMLFGAGLAPRLRLRNALLLVAVTVIIIGPWTYRNWRVHGGFVPVAGNFWENVWKGNNPHSSGTDRPVLTSDQLERYRLYGQDHLRQHDLLSDLQRHELNGRRALEREAIWKQYATSFIADNPVQYAQLSGQRLGKTLWAEWDNPRSRDPLYAYFTSRALLLLGSAAGLVLAIRQRWRIGWGLAVYGTCLLIYALTLTAARFALPLEPFQIALTALALVTGWQALFGIRERPPIVRRFMGDANDGTAGESLAVRG